VQIEEGETIFGKRWNLWTQEERREFARALEVQDLKYPIYFNFALEFLEDVSEEVAAYIAHLCPGGRERTAN
jgi:hypothetical protein